MSSPRPLLVCEGWRIGWKLDAGALLIALMVPAPLVGLLASPVLDPSKVSPPVWLAVCLAIAVGTGATLLFATSYVTSRAGRCELFEDGLVLQKARVGPFAVLELEWREVVGFEDGSADYVRLVRVEDALPLWTRFRQRVAVKRAPPFFLTLPTPDEETRQALLALLDARGVPRVE